MASEESIALFLKDFNPVSIGDPIGRLGRTAWELDDGVRYFPLSTWWHWGIIAFFVFAIVSYLYFFKYRAKMKMWRRIVFSAGFTVVSTALVAVIGLACSYYWGGPYAYENYQVPAEPADVLIWFSGSDDGAYYLDNYSRCRKQYPVVSRDEFRAALFNFSDIDKAVEYARRLPPGCRLVVRGHSMGAAAAMRFAQKCGYPIELLDTRDPTSWFGKCPAKPANVKYWRNVLPGETGWNIPEEQHHGTNYWGKTNMANVFRTMGGPWNHCDEATNVVMPGMDHREVGENIDEIVCKP